MISAVLAFAFAAVSLSYCGFALLLAVRSGRTLVTFSLALMGLFTGLWSLSELLAERFSWMPDWMPSVMGAVRDGLWLATALALLHRTVGTHRAWRALAIASAGLIAIHALLSGTAFTIGPVVGVRVDSALTGVVLTVLGLITVENLIRNSPPGEIWSIKHFAIGLSAVLGFQAIVRFPEFLTHTPDPVLDVARPFVYLTVLPLVTVSAIRIPSLQLRVHTSRKFVFHTAAIVCVGVLLQGTAIAAYYVRTYGGDNATVLAVLLGFAGVVTIAVAAASASVRARLKTFINENFFSYKYDYRVEWDRFNRSLAAQPEQKVANRVVRTLAEVLDSTGGILWERRESWRQFQPVAYFGVPGEAAPIAVGDALVAPFADPGLTFLELGDSDAGEVAIAWRARLQSGWIVVPLHHQSSLVGVVVLVKPRAPRKLDWEDHNLIGLVSSQLAVYLVQEEIVEALADARQLADFNKRFAFIVHDLKNATGQLSLLARNAERFGHQPEFRVDMVSTLRHAVGKLQQLLDQLKSDGATASAPVAGPMNLGKLLSEFVESKKRLGLPIVVSDIQTGDDTVVADAEAFRSVLEHVVANAIEASPPGEQIRIRVDRNNGHTSVTIVDQGSGMSRDFIAHELFRPLRSTKGGGLGIGAYQAREIIRDMGGDVVVESELGKGTSVILSLPATTSARKVSTA